MKQETAPEYVQMIHAGLDDDNGEIILRGVLVPETITALKVDAYQREILPIAKLDRKSVV